MTTRSAASLANQMTLGSRQLGCLSGLAQHGGWEFGCGWTWTSMNETLKIMHRLVDRRLAKVTRMNHLSPSTGDQAVRFTITPLGRTVLKNRRHDVP